MNCDNENFRCNFFNGMSVKGSFGYYVTLRDVEVGSSFCYVSHLRLYYVTLKVEIFNLFPPASLSVTNFVRKFKYEA